MKSADKIGEYFLSRPPETFFGKVKDKKVILDNNGIIYIEFKEKSIGTQYHPILIAEYALANYNKYLVTFRKEYKDTFLKHAGWLVKHQKNMGKCFVWLFNFDWNPIGYKCKSPWVSAMMQGQAVSVMIRAHKLTNDEKYLTIAKKALLAFETPISEGGVLYIDKNGDRWYEEYACQKRGSVLNGFVFSLVGLYELFRYTGDDKAKYLFDKGIDTLKKHLSDFELNLGFFRWTKYDNKYLKYSGIGYHKLHIQQMKILYEFTKNKTFLTYQRKWKYLQEKNIKKCRLISAIYFGIYLKVLELMAF